MKFEESLRKEEATLVARRMMTAARTAPKGKGADDIVIAIAEKEDMNKVLKEMQHIAQDAGSKFFLRDAYSVCEADAVLFFGAKTPPLDLTYCGYCGHTDCPTKKAEAPDAPCAIKVTDLGIAVGSAVSIAADLRVDTRVMFSAGIAARNLKLLGEDISIVWAVPLSIKGKSPFFDRQKQGEA